MGAGAASGRGLVLLTALVGGLLAGAARAGSIFDDDWNPPARSESTQPKETPGPTGPTSRPATGTTPVAPAGVSRPPAVSVPVRPTPATPGMPATPAAPLPAAAQSRRLVPPRADQARSRGLFKQVYAEALKDHSVAGLRRLAHALLADVPKYADNATDQFVLLGGALEAAQDGLSLPLCFQVADTTAKSYDVDGLLVKAEAASKVLPRPGAAGADNIKAGLELVGQLVEADDYTAAARVAAALQTAAAGDPATAKQVQQRKQEIDSARLARDRMAQQLEKLKSSPDDPAANAAVGAYLCYIKGQWDRGLPMLAKGTDAATKGLAAAELADPAGGEQIASVADGWYSAAAKQPPAARAKILQHTARLYRKSLAASGPAGAAVATSAGTATSTGGAVTGLHRKLIQQRLAELPPPGSDEVRRVDLLALLDPVQCTVAGNLQLSDGKVVSTSAWKGRVEFPYVPPDEYDYRIVFVYKRLPPSTSKADYGHDGTRQICYAGGRHFSWVLGAANGTNAWFDQVNGMGRVPDNPTMKQSAGWLEDGKRHTSVVKVRRNGVEGWLDDTLVSSLQTDFTNLSLWDGDLLRRPNTLGLGVWKDSAVVESAEVVEVSGPGTTLAPDAGLAPDPEPGPTARGREAIVVGTGAWAMEGEELAQTAPDKTGAVIFGNPTWSRYNLTLKAKSVTGREGFRVIFHFTDLHDYAELQAGAGDNQRHDVLVIHENRGVRSSKAAAPGTKLAPVERDRWYEIRFEARGSDCTCYLDGAKLFSYSDPRTTRGRIGVACGATAVRFRDIRVTSEDGSTVLWKGPPALPAKP